MGYFMNVGKEKRVGVTVCVDRDVRRMSGLPGEISELGDAGAPQRKMKSMFLPKLKAVREGSGWNAPFQQFSNSGQVHEGQDGHKNKKALAN